MKTSWRVLSKRVTQVSGDDDTEACEASRLFRYRPGNQRRLQRKNWDGLAALACILQTTRTSATVLDAGAALGSMILPWLFLYGYRSLVGVNLQFESYSEARTHSL